MKKFLSLILAILMIVSTVPMAMAIDINYNYDFNYDQKSLVEAILTAYVNIQNVYLPIENLVVEDKNWGRIEAEDINPLISSYYDSVFNQIKTDYPYFEENSETLLTLNAIPEAANALAKALAAANEEINKGIENGTLVVHINRRIELEFEYIFGKSEFMLIYFPGQISYEAQYKLSESYQEAFNICRLALYDPENYTQEDYDLAVSDLIDIYTQAFLCSQGQHDNKFINNNNGTHTTACSFCQLSNTTDCSYIDGKCICNAEEPIVDNNENTSTDNTTEEPESKTFFQKIAEFFKNLFEKLFGWMKK